LASKSSDFFRQIYNNRPGSIFENKCWVCSETLYQGRARQARPAARLAWIVRNERTGTSRGQGNAMVIVAEWEPIRTNAPNPAPSPKSPNLVKESGHGQHKCTASTQAPAPRASYPLIRAQRHCSREPGREPRLGAHPSQRIACTRHRDGGGPPHFDRIHIEGRSVQSDWTRRHLNRPSGRPGASR
jgi:hypothetical protein